MIDAESFLFSSFLNEMTISWEIKNTIYELQFRSRKARLKNKNQKLKFKTVNLDSKVRVTTRKFK